MRNKIKIKRAILYIIIGIIIIYQQSKALGIALIIINSLDMGMILEKIIEEMEEKEGNE